MAAAEKDLILVTGATGCLGSNLTRELVQRGMRLAIFRRPSDSTAALETATNLVEHRLGDIRDLQSVQRAFKGVSFVYHLAGISVPCNALHHQMMEVNVEGTRNVMVAAFREGVRRVVHTSSVSAVGFSDHGISADENFVYNGDKFNFSYGHTKRLGEQIVIEAVRKGVDAVIVNPAAVMAPGGDLKFSWAAVIDLIKRGRLPFYPGGGLAMATRRDMVDGHIKAMERGGKGERYIISSENITYRELFERVAGIVGARAPRLRIPDCFLQLAGWCNSLRARFSKDQLIDSTLLKETAPLLIRRVYYDQTKAVQELGMSQTPLTVAIEEVYEWYLSLAAGRPSST